MKFITITAIVGAVNATVEFAGEWETIDTFGECVPGADDMCKVSTDSCCKQYSSGEPLWIELEPPSSICHPKVSEDKTEKPFIKKRECYGRVGGASSLAAAAVGAATALYAVL